MVISRTPFRISFFGGGTDYPVWYLENGGSVVNATINKYCFVTARHLPPYFTYKNIFRYYLREEVNDIGEIKHPSIRECLKFLDCNQGIEIVHHADIPAQSGMGSSSTFTVGLLNALYALKNYMPTKRELAINAIHIEQDKIKENVGSQDQTAASFGGMNRIDFGGNEEISVTPIIISKDRFSTLQNNLMLFFSGFSRNATDIAKEQVKAVKRNSLELKEMMSLLEAGFSILKNNDDSLDELGKLLDQQWQIKRSLTSKISNTEIDNIYEKGIKAGALGGKLLGAGGGGFILFYVKPEYQESVKRVFSNLLYVPFRFEFTGSQIIYHSHDNNF